MNLIILLFVILGIQLIDASILKDENQNLETGNVTLQKYPNFADEDTTASKRKKFKDTKSLSFSKSKILKNGDQKSPQLVCGIPPFNEEDKEICDKYQASSAVCRNDNYQKEDTPKFTCKLSGMKVMNKNVNLGMTFIGCKEVDNKDAPTEYSPPCMMVYRLAKTGDYDPKDDIIMESNGGLKIGLIIFVVIFALVLVGSCLFAYKKKSNA